MGKKTKDPKNVGDEKQVKEDKLKFKTQTYIELEDLKDILKQPKVRDFLWRLLSEAKVHDFGYCGNNDMLNHIEGRRELGSWVIQQILTADPKAYTLMQTEAVSRDATNRGK